MRDSIPFLNRMTEDEFDGLLNKYINMDNTFNIGNKYSSEFIDDHTVIFYNKSLKILSIDKDDESIYFHFDEDGREYSDTYRQFKAMIEKFIIEPYQFTY